MSAHITFLDAEVKPYTDQVVVTFDRQALKEFIGQWNAARILNTDGRLVTLSYHEYELGAAELATTISEVEG